MENPHVFKVEEESGLSGLMRILYAPFSFLSPRKTCPWNVKELQGRESSELWTSFMYESKGKSNQCEDTYPLRLIPALGGWKEYIVLQPSPHHKTKKWFVGWKYKGITRVISIPIANCVTMLVGKGSVHFFGIDADTGKQIKILRNGHGSLGSGKHKNMLIL